MLNRVGFRPSPFLSLLLALLVGAFLRFWHLDSLPPGLHHDEAYNGLDSLSLLNGENFPLFYEGWELYAQDAHAERPSEPTRFPVFFEGNYGREPAHIYLMAAAISLLDATPFAIRSVPAAAGVIAILTTYLAGRAILESEERRTRGSATKEGSARTIRYAPIVAAFVLAALYPAVHFSRFGIRAMLFLPIETLTVACFWRGIAVANGKRSRLSGGLWFAAAGVLLGLGLYTYAVARLFPVLFAAFALGWFWRDRSAFRQLWGRLVIMAVVSLAVASPLLLFFIRYPFYFIFRIAFVSNRGAGAFADRPWLTWINNIGRVVRGLFWWGEANVHQNLPGRPFLDLVQAALFTLGSWVSLRRWRQPERIFLLLWLLVMLLPSVLSGDAPHFGRLSGAAPVIALLAGLGADWFIARALRWQLVGGERPAFASKASFGRLGTALVPVLLVISIAWTARDYFLKYAQHPDLGTSFYLSDWQLGQYAAAQPADANLYLTPTQAEMATIMFALADAGRLASYDGSNGLIPTGSPSSSSLYLVGEGEQASLNALSTYFPEGQSGSLQAGYVPFHVHPDAHRTPMQYTVDFVWDGKIRLVGWSQHQSEGQLVITFAWRAESRMEEDYTAYVHLLDQRDVLSTQLDRPPAGYPTSAWRPGEVIIDHYTLLLPPDLPSGEYQVQTGWYMYPSLDELGSPASLNELFIQN